MSVPPPGAIECLKSAGLRSVWLRQRDGRRTVVKAWPLGPITVIKLALGISQPQRHRRGTRATADAGVPTPAIVGGVRLARRGLVPVVELEHEYADGDEALDLLERDTLTEEEHRGVARACGRIVDAYRRAQLLHRDLKLANLVVDPSRRSVSVVDTLGVRRTGDVAMSVARMLERLWVQIDQGSMGVHRETRVAALRAALRPLSRSDRRAAFRRLRAYRRP
jgi:serine/threonine protein kinase